MRAQRWTAPSEAGADPALRRLGLLAPVFLASVLLARASDADPHPDFSHAPFVVAAFVLPFWYVSGIGRAVWTRWHAPLLVIQFVLAFAPFALFGAHWPGGVGGPLGALLLLTLRAPLNWVLFILPLRRSRYAGLDVPATSFVETVPAARSVSERARDTTSDREHRATRGFPPPTHVCSAHHAGQAATVLAPGGLDPRGRVLDHAPTLQHDGLGVDGLVDVAVR